MNIETNYELKVLWRSGTWTYYGPMNKDELAKRIQDIMPWGSWVALDVKEIHS